MLPLSDQGSALLLEADPTLDQRRMPVGFRDDLTTASFGKAYASSMRVAGRGMQVRLGLQGASEPSVNQPLEIDAFDAIRRRATLLPQERFSHHRGAS